MLYPVPQLPGPHLFCGPTAICAVTGLDQYDVLAAAHRYMRRRLDRPIVGMTEVQLTGTLALLGYATYLDRWQNQRGDRPTIKQFADSINHNIGTVILSLRDHYCAVTYDEYLCNQTNGEPVPIAQAPRIRSRVYAVIKVKPL